MTREERLTKIFETFDDCAKHYCNKSHGLFCEIVPVYKGSAKAENLKYRSAFIYYNSFSVEFKYTAHSQMSVTNSILECLVHLGKENDSIAIPLPLFLNYLEIVSFSPMFIPSIFDSNGMKQAFDCMEKVLSEYSHLISDTLGNADGMDRIFNAFVGEMSYILDVDINEDNFKFYTTEKLYAFLTLRFTAAPFINYIKGDIKTTIKQLSKIKKKTGYEESLLKSLKRGEAISASDLTIIKDNLASYGKSGVQNSASSKEFLSMFLSWIILCIGFTVIYGGFYLLLVFFEGRNSVYLMGPIYSLPYCVTVGFLTAIPASYFTRFKFYKLLFPKDFEKYCAADQVQNGKGADKLIRGMMTVIVIGSVVLSIFLAKWNVNFLEDGIVDNSKFLSLKGEYYDYADIDRVYYKPDRVNSFGETLNYPSYVIVLRDGKEIDLYEFDEIERYEDRLLSFLREKGVKVESSQTE